MEEKLEFKEHFHIRIVVPKKWRNPYTSPIDIQPSFWIELVPEKEVKKS